VSFTNPAPPATINVTAAAPDVVVTTPVTITNPDRLTLTLLNGARPFGSGQDGDLTITGSVGLTRDMFWRNLTMRPGGRLFANGYRIHVAGTLTLDDNAAIANEGGYGEAGSANAVAGWGAAGAPAVTFGVAGSGGGGRQQQAQPVGACDVSGGRGGSGGGGVAAGGGIVAPPWIILGDVSTLNTARRYAGGSGGGQGLTDGTLSGSGGGGGGAGGGGPLLICAQTLVLNGFITVQGGFGGRGADALNSAIGGGGGGGGGGGIIVVLYASRTGVGFLTAAGGGGGAGGNGASGNGAPGVTGAPGYVVELQL